MPRDLFLLKRFPERVVGCVVDVVRAARFSNRRDVRTRLSTPARRAHDRGGGVISGLYGWEV